MIEYWQFLLVYINRPRRTLYRNRNGSKVRGYSPTSVMWVQYPFARRPRCVVTTSSCYIAAAPTPRRTSAFELISTVCVAEHPTSGLRQSCCKREEPFSNLVAKYRLKCPSKEERDFFQLAANNVREPR
jgi:hypothetical protein